jgi:membrane-bound lytic murein transglycosylase F
LAGCLAPLVREADLAWKRVSAASDPQSVAGISEEGRLMALIRPGPPEDASATLDREIARGIAELLGEEVQFVCEDDESRMVERLLSGEVDLVAASLPITPEREERVAFSLPYGFTASGPVAVAVRPEDRELGLRVNEFLISHALIGPWDTVHTGDFSDIKARGQLRVLTVNGPASFFIHRGEPRGFEYELVKRFADLHGLTLEMVVPPTRADLVPWLIAGKGDVVAAGLTVRSQLAEKVAFTRPYQNVHEVIVVREGDRVRDLDDLRGRRVFVRASSSHWETLQELRQYEDDFEIAIVPETCDLEDILDRVEDGTWDVTVCDSHVLEMERASGRRLEAAFSIKAVRHGWAVRPQNPELRDALDAFLRREYRGLYFNVLRQRYFESPRDLACVRDDFRSDVSGRISPYDDLIRERAEQCGLDWRLIAAQIYQESRFDRTQLSFAGAAGLMQLMPRTAAELGVAEREDPESSIRAGTEYLRSLIDRFEPELPLATRIRFALASYNVGKGHVDDARRLAARLGWSADRWYGSVERALVLLQRPEYYRQARFGYCRGTETVRYVREIDRHYRTYVEHVPVELALVQTSSAETVR